MLIDDLKPPLILHSYNPATEGVKVENFRLRDIGSFLVHGTLLTDLLQPSTRRCVINECQFGLWRLSSHFWHVMKIPLLPTGLYKTVPFTGWLSIINSMPSHRPSTMVTIPTVTRII